MDPNFQTWMIVFAAATAVAVTLQMAILLGLFLAVRRSTKRMEQAVDEVRARTLPLLDTAQRIAADAEPKIRMVTTDMVEMSGQLKQHVATLEGPVGVAVEQAQEHLRRVNTMVGRALDGVERTTDTVSGVVTAPARQVSGVVSALGAALGAYFRRGERGAQAVRGRKDQDEMFI